MRDAPLEGGFHFFNFFRVKKKTGPEIWTPTELVNFLLVNFQTSLEPILSICFSKKIQQTPVYEILALLTFFQASKLRVPNEQLLWPETEQHQAGLSGGQSS